MKKSAEAGGPGALAPVSPAPAGSAPVPSGGGKGRPAAAARSASQHSLRWHGIVAVVAVIALVFGVGGWAATTQISGAVIASGVLVVNSNVKKVQHPSGGVIAALNVDDGSHVKAGEVVARLDDTRARAQLGLITRNLDEMQAREARLQAEREGDTRVAFPPSLTGRADDADVSRLMKAETRLFELRREARDGQKAQLNERVAQLEQQIGGLEEQSRAKEREIALIGEELSGVESLWKQRLVQFTRVVALQRDEARLKGERGDLIASIAAARGRIAEINLQSIQVDQDMRSEVAKELSDVRTEISKLGEQRIAAQDELTRIDIRAPQDGVVHELSVHTIGGVVGAGEQLMLVVPTSDALSVDARIAPQDIDQIHDGLEALLRFSAFNARTTPEVLGKVERVSPDLVQDPKTGLSFYTVRITIPPGALAELGKLKLIAGMPVEVFIHTDDRTVLSYLTKPLADQIARAFRES